jgi:hypothetical protein
VQRLPATSSDNHDHERAFFCRRRSPDLVKHLETGGLFGGHHLVSQLVHGQAGEISGIGFAVGEPDISTH